MQNLVRPLIKLQIGGIVYNPYISPEYKPINGFVPEEPEPYTPSTTFNDTKKKEEKVEVAPLPKQVKQEETQPAETQENPRSTKTSTVYTDRNKFISDMTTAYAKELSKRGIDRMYAKYLAIQDGLESNFGKSYAGNGNFGNIIVGSSKASYTEGGDKDANGKPITQKFRNYNSLEDFIKHKIDLLSSARYRAFIGNIDQFYDRVKAGGYATAPNYVAALKKLYAQYA